MRALATAVATVAVVLLLAAGSARDGRGQSITTLPDSVLPRKYNKTWLPDEWLLGGGQPWHHRVAARPPGAPLGTAAPTSQKPAAVQEVRHLVERYELKVVALVDDGRAIEIAARPGISLSTLLMSASMGKTVTAVAAGKAVCAGLLRLDTTAGSLVPALAGSDLGKATLRDLLTMTSGVVEPPPRNATGLTRDETARLSVVR